MQTKVYNVKKTINSRPSKNISIYKNILNFYFELRNNKVGNNISHN